MRNIAGLVAFVIALLHAASGIAADYHKIVVSMDGWVYAAIEVAAEQFHRDVPDARMQDYVIRVHQINDQFLIAFREDGAPVSYDVYVEIDDLTVVFAGYID